MKRLLLLIAAFGLVLAACGGSSSTAATVDETEILDLVRRAEQIAADQLVIIPLYAHGVTAAVWADEIANFKHNPTSAGYAWNIEFWYRADLSP